MVRVNPRRLNLFAKPFFAKVSLARRDLAKLLNEFLKISKLYKNK